MRCPLFTIIFCFWHWVAYADHLPVANAACNGGGPTKYALIVGVGDYPSASGWMTISSVNDVSLVQAALEHQGFLKDNIQILTDAAATKAAVVAALESLANRVKANDVVVFHFSGHGQQLLDDNHDESDGLDEALVPYDAAMHFAPGHYEGQNHLRDDQLGSLLGRIRQNAGRGGEVLAVIDACHSGTSTRGLARSRGTFEIMAPPGYKSTATQLTECTEGCTFGVGEGEAIKDVTMAPLVCYFGSSPNQLNFEAIDQKGRSVGSLSLAFSRALTATASPTYAGLFDRIRSEMASTAPNQTPQMEGPANGQVFRGRTVAVPTHYRTTTWLDNQRVLLDGGTLNGLRENTEIAFYPPDSELNNSAHPLATGKVSYCELASSTVTLDKPLAGSKPVAWAVVTKQAFGSLNMRIRLDLPPGAVNDSLQAVIRRRPFIQLVNGPTADLLLEWQQANAGLTLTSSQDQKVLSLSNPAADPAGAATAVVDAIAAMAQTKYLRGIEAEAAQVAVELTLVPVSTKSQGSYRVVDRQFDPSTKLDKAGNTVYKLDDYMQLKVTNKGTKTAYYTILDIQPDNKITVLLPRADEEAASYILQPGQTLLLPSSYRTALPLGEEVMKTIASEVPLDLRPVVANQGSRGGMSASSPFSALLDNTFYPDKSHSRGAEPEKLRPGTVNVHNTVYQIAAHPQP